MRTTIESMDHAIEYFRSFADSLDTVDSGENMYAERMREIIADIGNDQNVTTLAFCGLFSAGKSSLINALCGDDTLETGAIPTTAEVATVRLPGTRHHVMLLDTPGVDSTDESHREATMNALYRADAIVLVVDYQHVEAEENLDLLRQFVEAGKQIVFVVNQIDKHMDFEMSFDDFKHGVQAVLGDYGMEGAKVFFTSSGESQYNQLNALKAWLQSLGDSDTDNAQSQVAMRLTGVAREAIQSHFADEEADALAAIVALYGVTPIDQTEVADWFNEAESQAQALEEKLQLEYQVGVDKRRTMRESWVRTVELAQISPYETTEKGRLFVESLVPDFKIGFFRSARKTQAEQIRRATQFVDDLNSRVQNYLLMPLSNQMVDDMRQAEFDGIDTVSDVGNLQLHITPDYVQSIVKEGALVSSQYPYQYAKDVVARIKRDVLAQLSTVVDAWFEAAKDQFFKAHLAYEEEIKQFHAKMASIEAYQAVIGRIEEAEKAVEAREVPAL